MVARRLGLKAGWPRIAVPAALRRQLSDYLHCLNRLPLAADDGELLVPIAPTARRSRWVIAGFEGCSLGSSRGLAHVGARKRARYASEDSCGAAFTIYEPRLLRRAELRLRPAKPSHG